MLGKMYFGLIVVLLLGQAVAFKPVNSFARFPLKNIGNLNMKSEVSSSSSSKNPFQSFVKATIPAVFCAATLLSVNQEVLALQSGGRSGGSSFSRSSSSSRGSSSTRSYSTSRSYSSYATPVIPSPSYSPFYSPFSFGFGYSPFYSPFSFGFFNPNLFLLGAMAYIAYQVLKNRIGGSDFASEDMSGDSGYLGSLGAGATVINLQV
jgi:uncharacterized membrane protein